MGEPIKRIYLIFVIYILFVGCNSSDTVNFNNNRIYVTCTWMTESYFDFTPSSQNKGSYLKFSVGYASVDADKVNKIIYDHYSSIFQYFANGKREIFLIYDKQIDEYGNTEEEIQYLCTIDIDELKKYKNYPLYKLGSYGKNSFLRSYEAYKKTKTSKI